MREGALIGGADARPGSGDGLLTLGEAARRARQYLSDRGSPSARLDADLLAAKALGIERIAVYTEHDRPLTESERAGFRELLRRRGAGEPMAYILGNRAFRRLELEVGPGVLVPRPETELLVEWALELARPGDRILDWGTGSGAIALALADEGTDLRITGLEASPTALDYAKRNAQRLGLAVELVGSDAPLAGREFELVVANPPYLAVDELEALGPELRFEPVEALVSGPTGLEALTRVANEARSIIAPGGWLVLEIGAHQAGAVRALLADAGFPDGELRADLAGLDRAVAARTSR